jgi:Arc/MetJ family transcription regulator
MRVSIDIDARLMRRAMRTGKGRTKRALVEAGLELLVQTYSQPRIRRLKRQVRKLGNLGAWR